MQILGIRNFSHPDLLVCLSL